MGLRAQQVLGLKSHGVAWSRTAGRELGDRDHLIATHPGFRDEIIDFTK